MIQILYFIILYIYLMWLLPLFLILLKPFSKLFGIKFNTTLSYKLFYKLLNIKQKYIKKETLIEEGFIFSNHRSWTDFAIDNYIMDSTPLGRYLAFIMMGFWAVLSIMENRTIMFKRNKANRKYLYNLCQDKIIKGGYYNKRVLIYPEGTRLDYTNLYSKEDIKSKFKIGMIKEIYERSEYPIQIVISSNKENVLNEKKLKINRGIEIKSALSKGIHPKDYSSFEEFLDKIAEEWFELWRITHL